MAEAQELTAVEVSVAATAETRHLDHSLLAVAAEAQHGTAVADRLLLAAVAVAAINQIPPAALETVQQLLHRKEIQVELQVASLAIIKAQAVAVEPVVAAKMVIHGVQGSAAQL